MSKGAAIRVLLVDDEEEYRETLARVLRRRGLEVRTAGDGEQALTCLAGETFDVILLDLRMPVLDGQATLQALRRRDALTQVLLLSGQADLAAARAALEAGAADVLLKPCSIDVLLPAVEDAAEVTRAARGVAARSRES